jgi:hypothetical protein
VPRAIDYTKESLRIALVQWLYDERQGWYLVKRLTNGQYQDVKVLNRSEAIAWVNPNPKEYVLELKHFYGRTS